MKEWFVIQTHHNLENLAIESIKKFGFDVYCPKYLKTVNHARKVKKILKPLFSRYIFVSFDKKKDSWFKINFLRGVKSLLMLDKHLSSLPSFFVENLKKYENKEGVLNFYEYATATKKDKNFKFLFSNQKIIEGEFSGIEKKNKVKLLIHLFGRRLLCWVSKNNIETA